MNRRDFLMNSCTACLSASAMAGLLSSCKSPQFISGRLSKDGLLVNKDDFKIKGGNKDDYLPYVVVRHDELRFPVCVYRFSDADYTAIWMQCAHQGAELQVAGSYLNCPAHGSEYNNRGHVTNGPAEKDLRTFPVTVNNSQLFIDLRKK